MKITSIDKWIAILFGIICELSLINANKLLKQNEENFSDNSGEYQSSYKY